MTNGDDGVPTSNGKSSNSSNSSSNTNRIGTPLVLLSVGLVAWAASAALRSALSDPTHKEGALGQQSVLTTLHDGSENDGGISQPPRRCSDESIAALTAALQSNPQEFGLRPWSPPSPSPKKHGNNKRIIAADDDANAYPGLDDGLLNRTFRGRKIVFIGDSTLYYLNKWIHALLTRVEPETLANLSSLDLRVGNGLVNPTGDPHVDVPFTTVRTELPPSSGGDDDDGEHDRGATMIAWTGIVGAGVDTCGPNIDKRFQKLRQYQPTIIIANFGLHWLHFTGYGRNVKGCAVERWVRYEEEWMNRVVRAAEEIGRGRPDGTSDATKTVLLFKTVNRICSDKYVGEYAVADRLYSAAGASDGDGDGDGEDHNNVTRVCRDLVRRSVSDAGGRVGANDVDAFCRNGTFNEVGAAHLNERMARLVDRWRRKNIMNKNNGGNGDKTVTTTALAYVGLFNDHDVETCPYTAKADGRHYHELNLLRIRLLGNVLECVT